MIETAKILFDLSMWCLFWAFLPETSIIELVGWLSWEHSIRLDLSLLHCLVLSHTSEKTMPKKTLPGHNCNCIARWAQDVIVDVYQINTRDVIGRLGMTLWKRALKDLSPLCLWSTNSNYCGSQQTICPGIRKCSKHQTVFFQTINFPTVFFQSIFLRSVPGLRTGWFFGVHCQK